MLGLQALRIDAGSGKASAITLRGLGPVDAGVVMHLERETYSRNPLGPENPLLIGWGPFSLTPLFGAHRLTLVFRSPLTGGLHVSTLGGAAWALARTGLDGVILEGRSREPIVISVIDRGSGIETMAYSLSWEKLWNIYEGYKGYRGTRALHMFVVDKLSSLLDGIEYRILLVGPAAWRTPYAGVFSWVSLPDGRPGPVVDSASRGGAGSVMAQGHGVAAVVAGGPRARVRRDGAEGVRRIVERVLGEPYPRAVGRVTSKYRFDPRLGTGGTFGVNYVHYRELIPALAYNTIYMSRSVRLLLHEKIMRYFWKPFQDEVFPSSGPRPWRTCGEPCSVACKKIYRGVKLDYEPSHAMGPMIGVITLEDAAGLVELADELGVDAIEAGHIIAWTFDSVIRGLLEPGEAGLGGRPVLDPLALGPESSRLNATLARGLLEYIALGRGMIGSRTAQYGARAAAAMLDEEYKSRVERAGLGFRDILVYAAFGARGYMTPNYYWSPGMVAPLFVLGRYWTNYSPAYMEPEEYARDSLRRAVSELLIDNAGICRFHRKWAEKVLQALYEEMIGINIDLQAHALRTYRMVAEYSEKAGAEPVPWESMKTMDIVATIASELGIPGWDKIPPRETLLDWWRRFYSTVRALVTQGEV